MKVLLVCNTALPEIEKKYHLAASKPESWLLGHVAALGKVPGVQIAMCFPIRPHQESITAVIDDIRYYSYVRYPDMLSYSDATEQEFADIFKKEMPDIIHAFGTEFVHTLAAVNAARKCGMIHKLVISIQGLVSMCGGYHYYAGLPPYAVCARTIRDVLKRDSIRKQRNGFVRRGEFEKEAIRKAVHIIGRTDWDHACVTQINPNIHYHFCNETLRESFYEHHWSLDACEKHSIFVSQANYPLKGFHKMLEAMALIVKKYPDARLYTTGVDPTQAKTFLKKQRQTYYMRYLAQKIQKLGLEGNVVFTGYLEEKAMCERFCKSHVFVSPSSIENSPNSLGEAMLLGVPCVASDVGGVKNLMRHNEDGFIYPFDEPYMLAYYVDKIFSGDDLAQSLSEKAKAHAAVTHHRKINADRMMQIYKDICS